MQEIKVIHEPTEEEPFVIVHKAPLLPSAPLTEEDKHNALSLTMEKFPSIGSVSGRKAIEYGLLHRLDTDTEGLLMMATTQDFYDYMLNEQKEGRFLKTYSSISSYNKDNCKALEGFAPYPLDPHLDFIGLKLRVEVSSYFRPYGKGSTCVRPVTESSGRASLKKLKSHKLYTTTIQVSHKDGLLKTQCTIKEGFRHQVRCHLAWLNLPCVGDKLYNACYNGEALKFYATALDFKLPSGSPMHFSIDI